MMGIAPLALQPTKHGWNLNMSAYVVVELTVKDATAKDRYSAAAGPGRRDRTYNRAGTSPIDKICR